jgi:hypothetical protein
MQRKVSKWTTRFGKCAAAGVDDEDDANARLFLMVALIIFLRQRF